MSLPSPPSSTSLPSPPASDSPAAVPRMRSAPSVRLSAMSRASISARLMIVPVEAMRKLSIVSAALPDSALMIVIESELPANEMSRSLEPASRRRKRTSASS
jgi:hypothetical protein